MSKKVRYIVLVGLIITVTTILLVQIVASIEIDPNDWGGVAFYIPDKWYISNIISSYPENETQSKPRDYVATATIVESNSHEWRAWIEVGTDHSWRPTGGGTGTIVIDIVPDQNVIQTIRDIPYCGCSRV